MSEWAVVVIALSVLGWALVQRRAASTVVTGPMVFIALGLLVGSEGFGLIELGTGSASPVVDTVLQGTLALLLYTDAAALHPSSWRKEVSLPARLLGIGLPLTIATGWLIAVLLFDGLSGWEAAIVAAMIAPTDAALGQAVISNPRVPERVRTGLDVESGLNDGVSLPFILLFMGFAAEGFSGGGILSTFVEAIGVAVAVGIAVAFVAAWLLSRASSSGWMGSTWSQIALAAIAVITFAVADQLGGSGFIACFAGGLTYGERVRGHLLDNETFTDDLGAVLTQISFLLVGAVVIGPALAATTWQVWVMAALALTLARIGPVAVALIGTSVRWPTVGYLGWFGPRGLATIVFGVLVVEEADLPGTQTIIVIAATTVFMSVYAHGLTASTGASRYSDWAEKESRKGDLAEASPLKTTVSRTRFQEPSGS